MIDPLAQAVTLLAPRASYSKTVSGAGSWRVRRSHGGEPGYFVILDGSCRLSIDGADHILQAGDFVLVPAAHGFAMSSLAPPPAEAPDDVPVNVRPGEFRLGHQDGAAEVLYLIGHFVFEAPDAALLVSLLPRVVLVRGRQRLATLVQLVDDESRAARPARDVVLSRLDGVDNQQLMASIRDMSAQRRFEHALHEEKERAQVTLNYGQYDEGDGQTGNNAAS